MSPRLNTYNPKKQGGMSIYTIYTIYTKKMFIKLKVAIYIYLDAEVI